MSRFAFEDLQPFESKVVILTSTEGEAMRATLAHVDREHGDVIVDITETNQPERYEKLGRQVKSCSWVIPWEYIADIRLAG